MSYKRNDAQPDTRPRLVKLVRDRVGEFLPSENTEVIYAKIANGDDRRAEIRKKLIEEAIEFLVDPCIEELADVYECVRGIAYEQGWSMNQVRDAADAKEEERGGFVAGMAMWVHTKPRKS